MLVGLVALFVCLFGWLVCLIVRSEVGIDVKRGREVAGWFGGFVSLVALFVWLVVCLLVWFVGLYVCFVRSLLSLCFLCDCVVSFVCLLGWLGFCLFLSLCWQLPLFVCLFVLATSLVLHDIANLFIVYCCLSVSVG